MHLYFEHKAVFKLWASMQFRATAFIKVDLPEAFDPKVTDVVAKAVMDLIK